MSNATAQSAKLSATLVLNDDVGLRGKLSAIGDGRLRLDSLRLIDNSHPWQASALKPGSNGTLSLVSDHSGKDRDYSVQVVVAELQGDCLTLDFGPHEVRMAEEISSLLDARDPHGTAKPAGPTLVTHATTKGAASNLNLTAASAEYQPLLAALYRQSLDELKLALSQFFTDLTQYLLDLSSRIKHSEGDRNPHYDAAAILQRNTTLVEQQILEQISGYYNDLTPPESEDQLWQYDMDGKEELHLIDLQEFEDFLAIDRMVTLGEDLHSLALESLTVRLSTLVGEDPNSVRLPVHVRQLCRAFQRALVGAGVPQEVLSHIFDYFGKNFIRQLGGYYAPLNTQLATQGVYPNVEVDILSKGSLLKRNQAPARPERKVSERPRQTYQNSNTGYPETIQGSNSLAADQIHQQLGEKLAGALGQVNPARLYRSVVDALNFKREAEGLADGNLLASGAAISGTWDGATVASSELDQGKLADAQSIARALGALQHSSKAREEVQEVDSLRAYLAGNKENIGVLQDTSGLTADSLNQLDMVDNLFGTIKSQLDVSADLKPALGNLQIPLAKLALMDPRFFVDHSHAARAVVDKLSHLATSANFPNRALEGRINTIVDEIIADYETDSSVFDAALEKIDRLAAQQERALARNVERVVRTQEGQQKLAEARRAVGNLISSHLQAKEVPKVMVDLIESGWRDLLVLTHVKEGPDSDNWAEQVKTLELLSTWLDQQHQGGTDEDVRVQRSLEAGPLIDLIDHQITEALPTNISHTAVLEQLRDILAGTAEVESTKLAEDISRPEPEPRELRAKIEDLPRLRRWVKRVEQLEKDSWLTYRDKNGKHKRMQLAWFSPERDRYIFVNERGQKVADLSAIKLARQLSQGVQPPPPTDDLSVVDKSMYHTLEHVQKTLSFARNHDYVTKLINRETFMNQMARALRHSQLKHSQHAVLYLDIDQFKLVNDVYDKISGDQVLLEFARLLAQLHGKKSSSARIGGDEFAVLLLDRDLDQSAGIAEKIRRDIEASSVDIEGENVSFTVSVGVATIADYSPGVEEVLASARSAMLHAKQLGRNQVARFEEDQSDALNFREEQKSTRENLEKALETDRFILRAQPIVQTAVNDTNTRSLHYELLLALIDDNGALTSPEEFIQSAERYGFMSLVDRWVVREAFSWVSELMDAQKVVPNIAINLSGTSVTDDSFMDYLLEQISEFGVGTSKLCFEITETGTISNLVKAADFVRAFRNIGCKFSIDDFGTGLASHNYLRELPVDYVKIDGSFVTGIHKNRNDYAMARSINDLAHFLGQETIAESVENDDIIEKLEDIGVDYLQGWGIGKPKPLVEVTTDLSNLEK